MLKGQLWSVSQFHDVFMHAFQRCNRSFCWNSIPILEAIFHTVIIPLCQKEMKGGWIWLNIVLICLKHG
jgi:hypothetical protein